MEEYARLTEADADRGLEISNTTRAYALLHLLKLKGYFLDDDDATKKFLEKTRCFLSQCSDLFLPNSPQPLLLDIFLDATPFQEDLSFPKKINRFDLLSLLQNPFELKYAASLSKAIESFRMAISVAFRFEKNFYSENRGGLIAIADDYNHSSFIRSRLGYVRTLAILHKIQGNDYKEKFATLARHAITSSNPRDDSIPSTWKADIRVPQRKEVLDFMAGLDFEEGDELARPRLAKELDEPIDSQVDHGSFFDEFPTPQFFVDSIFKGIDDIPLHFSLVPR